MRLFVAADLSPEVRAELTHAVSPVRARHVARWTAPERWHLTLAFLGETPEEALPAVRAALDLAAAGAEPLVLRVQGSGLFGGRRPRVLWLGLAGDTEAAERLAVVLNARLGLEARGGLHLTLARAGRDPRALGLAKRDLAEVGSSPFEVRQLVLYVSTGGAWSPVHPAALGRKTPPPG